MWLPALRPVIGPVHSPASPSTPSSDGCSSQDAWGSCCGQVSWPGTHAGSSIQEPRPPPPSGKKTSK
ncbi:hypothetical protein P7K49_012231 [Saguinus oedipus]|uniref:Uncharacterized protein n=1 Tax=Saguinus oedipus TaxID=9490 RepID=A0ABQ9VSW6_SAGOE|nr:hypothetical protein P7K49_012231 [Saguinus oedipus]